MTIEIIEKLEQELKYKNEIIESLTQELQSKDNEIEQLMNEIKNMENNNKRKSNNYYYIEQHINVFAKDFVDNFPNEELKALMTDPGYAISQSIKVKKRQSRKCHAVSRNLKCIENTADY
jgi:chromosome segregation ATPase